MATPENTQNNVGSTKKFPWWALVFWGPVLFFVVGPCRYRVGPWLLAGIGPGAADYDYRLSGGLSLLRAASNMRIVCWLDEDDPEKDEMRQYGLANTSILIDADVSAIGWNDRYIVCYQADSPAADERKTGWWIVDTQQRQRIGPMDEPEFREGLERLGISDLEIKPPEDWR